MTLGPLSTTSRGQHASRAKLLDRAEIEVFEDRPRLAIYERPPVADHQLQPEAEHAIGQARWCFIEQHEIHRSPSGSFQPSSEIAKLENRKFDFGAEPKGKVDVAPAMHTTHTRPEKERVGDPGIGFQYPAQRFTHSGILSG
jgi:hypothetical protein